MTTDRKSDPEANQGSVAPTDLNEIEEADWDSAFSRSPDALAKLAGIAMAEYHAGKTQELNLETLYLLSVPGMVESIQKGLVTPIQDCAKDLECDDFKRGRSGGNM